MSKEAKYPVNLELFNRTSHNPSYHSLQSSMGDIDLKIIDYCIPVNSYFPTAEMIKHYADNIYEILKYYPDHGEDLSKIVAKVFGYQSENLIMCNGATELVTYLNQHFVKESICVPVPTWGRWTDQPKELGKKVVYYERKEENDYHLNPQDFVDFALKNKVDSVVICNPNNPTGALLSKHEMMEIIDGLSSIGLIIVDEAFIDFSYEDAKDIPSVSDVATQRENLVVVKSLGKNLGLHGVRLGYGIACEKVIQKLYTLTPKWNINGMSEALILDLEKYFQDYEMARKRQVQDRLYFENRLLEVPYLKVFPSITNFIYVKLPEHVDGVQLRNNLILNHGCFIRLCHDKIGSSGQYIRLAVRPKDQTDILINALNEELSQFSLKEVAQR